MFMANPGLKCIMNNVNINTKDIFEVVIWLKIDPWPFKASWDWIELTKACNFHVQQIREKEEMEIELEK